MCQSLGHKIASALSALNFRVTGSGRGNESLRNGRVAGLVASSTTRTFCFNRRCEPKEKDPIRGCPTDRAQFVYQAETCRLVER